MKNIIIILLLTLLASCKEKSSGISPVKPMQTTGKSKNQKAKDNVFLFYIDENKPVFDDKYLFSPTPKKYIKRNMGKIEWYLIDWNENNIYDEVGIDYIGVKNKFDQNPYIELLKDRVYINFNGKTFITQSKDHYKTVQKSDKYIGGKLNIITKIVPLVLEDGSIYIPETDKDTLVLYFWATWCAPCVKKVKYANENISKINESGIDFIPVAYKCSGIKDFFEKNNINFQPLTASDKTGNDYRLFSLPKTFVFNKKGELTGNRFNIKPNEK